MFISRLKGAYDELEIQGDQRQDIAKVNDLLLKTKDDSALEHARAHIRGNPTLIADFQGAINYMTVQVMAKTQDQNDNRGRRQISSVNSRNPRNGNNRSRNFTIPSNLRDRFSSNGILLNGGDYSNELWNSLSQEDKNYVLEVCAQRRQTNERGGGRGRGRGGRGHGRGRGGRGGGDRNVSGVETNGRNQQEQGNDGDAAQGAGSGMRR